jgi:hypothetical protein
MDSANEVKPKLVLIKSEGKNPQGSPAVIDMGVAAMMEGMFGSSDQSATVMPTSNVVSFAYYLAKKNSKTSDS